MSQELIYTSAPKGLRLGARGFCTVASTPGMAKNLADRLESLSGYRHLFPPGSPEAHLNPVNFSYLKFTLGGQAYYLLSRIADAGLDYTQRTNKLAHHIVLHHSELPDAGPAWLASQPGLFETTWSREPELLPDNHRPIPQGRLSADVCSAWKLATGDAGWAGVLAEHKMRHGSDEAYLICRPGTNLLELFIEAQALLPIDQRWATTFSTYFTKLPPGIDCRWRGVIEGSPEAIRARRSPDKLVIDLTSRKSEASGGELVALARSGRQVVTADSRSASETTDLLSAVELSTSRSTGPGRDLANQDVGAFRSPTAPRPPALPQRRHFGWDPMTVGKGLSRRERAAWMSAILILLISLCGLTYYFTRSSKEMLEPTTVTSNGERKDQTPSDQRPSGGEQPQKQTPPAPQEGEVAEENSPPPKPADSVPHLTAKQKVATSTSVDTQKTTVVSPHPVSKRNRADILDSRILQIAIELPETISQSRLNEDWKKPIQIVTFKAEKPALDMALLGCGKEGMKLLIFKPASDMASEWSISVANPDGTSEMLARVNFNPQNARQLQITLADIARSESAAFTLLRDSILQIRFIDSEPDPPLLVSFVRVPKPSEPVLADVSELVDSGRWKFRPKDIAIPDHQRAIARVRLAGMQPDVKKTILLRPNQPGIIAVGEPQLARIRLSLDLHKEQPSFTISLLAPEEGDKLFATWYQSQLKDRERLLRDAIESYIEAKDKSIWQTLRELDFPFITSQSRDDFGTPTGPQTTTLGEYVDYLRKLKRQQLNDIELRLRKEFTPPNEKAPIESPYLPLAKHEKKLPKLDTMKSRIKESLRDLTLHLHLARAVDAEGEPSGVPAAEIAVYDAGQL